MMTEENTMKMKEIKGKIKRREEGKKTK